MTTRFINKTYLGRKVKVFFKQHDRRIAMIGKFVNLADSEDLSSKNMIRFVNQSRLDYWVDSFPNIGLTKIYNADDFTIITEV